MFGWVFFLQSKKSKCDPSLQKQNRGSTPEPRASSRGNLRPAGWPGSGEWPEPVLATSPFCFSIKSKTLVPPNQHLHPLLLLFILHHLLHPPRCCHGQSLPIPLSKVLPVLTGLSGREWRPQLRCLWPQLRCLRPPNSSGRGCSAPHAQTKHQLGREEVLAPGAGLESSKKKQNKAVVLRKVKPTPFLHKYHQGRGG